MKRIETKFGLYCDELKIHEADILADVGPTKVEILSVTVPWVYPNGQKAYMDVIQMLTLSTLSELKDYVRGAYGAQDAIVDWDHGPDVA